MIGVFDSGIGGLTLLNEIKRQLPAEDFIYYADTDHVPYSFKTTDQIKVYVENAILDLIGRGCTALVLACNTATNVAVEYLREKYPYLIIAIQPAIKVAADHNTAQKRILATATPVTLASNRFNNLVNRLEIGHLVDYLPLPGLVSFAEEGIFDGPAVETYLKTEIGQFNIADYTYIVLGCTHFTYFQRVIEDLFPNLVLVDGNEGTARHLKNEMTRLNLLSNHGSGQVVFIESGRVVVDPKRFLGYLGRLA